MKKKVKLGVNIDHVATLRNARGEFHPSVLKAATIVKTEGGDGITVHLREDRRHIRDADVFEIKKNVALPINFEMAATIEMQNIAIKLKPNSCCIVPEKREEITTEGGLDIAKNYENLSAIIKKLKDNNILVSLFIDADLEQVKLAQKIGADILEFHTGRYCHTLADARKHELKKISDAAKLAGSLGIICHAGHGLTYETVPDIVKIPEISELNIGHFLIGEAIFDGLENTIKKMKNVIETSL